MINLPDMMELTKYRGICNEKCNRNLILGDFVNSILKN